LSSKINKEFIHWAYKKIYTIRLFEERLLQLFSEGKLSGTTHTYIGQEATAVSVLWHSQEADIIFSNHRCHGHFIARHGNYKNLMAEIMGKVDGVCGGIGGSQHIFFENFYSNGIQGGYLPIAAGSAFTQKLSGHNGITFAFIGDGTLGEGNVYEGLNLAKLKEVPLFLVIENNRYAQSTPVQTALAGDIKSRVLAFGWHVDEIESNDILEIEKVANRLISLIRQGKGPMCLIVHNYRFAAHSKGDDFRDKDEILTWKKKDPLTLIQKYVDSTWAKKTRSDILAKLDIVVQEVTEMNDAI
jgi:TPP-dependent pyruvate/acetoin dehydrogenase alpha subunit